METALSKIMCLFDKRARRVPSGPASAQSIHLLKENTSTKSSLMMTETSALNVADVSRTGVGFRPVRTPPGPRRYLRLPLVLKEDSIPLVHVASGTLTIVSMHVRETQSQTPERPSVEEKLTLNRWKP